MEAISINVNKIREEMIILIEHFKTRTKNAHKNVSQGFNKLRKSNSKQITQYLHNIQVILCDHKSYAFIKNRLINKGARKNLAKRALCDLP